MKKEKCEIITPEKAKELLNITDFHSIPVKKGMDFLSLTPKMDREQAIACYKQFPHFKELASKVNEDLQGLCRLALEQNKESTKQILNEYSRILEELEKELHKPFIFGKRKERIITQQLEIIQKMVEFNQSNKDFLKDILNNAMKVGGYVLVAALAILDVAGKRKI